MAWQEILASRNRWSRTYQANARLRRWSGTLTPLHYEGVIDSGVYDAEIDATPERVINAQADGWRITANGWHYFLGQDLANHGSEDGWVGFGGRHGAHWFKFRLLRAGYLHWPTRTWQDIGGAPSYNRGNLNRETHSITMGPNDDVVNVEARAIWSNIWQPPSGSVSVSWRANGDRLKEEITVNQAAREWIAASAPPSTPLDETWFGFVFRLDWSDIPKCVRDGIQQDIDGDFADDGQTIEICDSLDRLLGFMPVSQAHVETEDDWAAVPLRKRFWRQNGVHYLLVGARCDLLNALPDGELVFDPDVNVQVGDNADDGYIDGAGEIYGSNAAMYVGPYDAADWNIWARWTGVTVAGTVTTATAQFCVYTASNNDPRNTIYFEDADNPSAPSSAADYNGRTPTSNSVVTDCNDIVDAWYTTPELSDIIQELVTSYTISNDAVQMLWKNTDSGWKYDRFYQRDGDSAKAPKLDITYSTGRVFSPVHFPPFNPLRGVL